MRASADQSRRHAKASIAGSGPKGPASQLSSGSDREPTKPAKALADSPKTHTAIGQVIGHTYRARLAGLNQRNYIQACTCAMACTGTVRL
jgi:hypothetical protein